MTGLFTILAARGNLTSLIRSTAMGAFVLGAAAVAYAPSAQSATPPLVDFNSSPTVPKNEPANVSLALSVEWPTTALSYLGASYVHDPVNAPYLGYWDAYSCYRYKDPTSTDLNGEYFYRIGPTDGNGYCTSAYSGNLLNYVTTSAIDILRMGLSGGYRVVDTASSTVLERAYLALVWASDWSFMNSTYTPVRKISKTLVGKVMPTDATPLANTTDVFATNCENVVWFSRIAGTANGDCKTGLDKTTPSTNYGSLNPPGGGFVGTVAYNQRMYARVKVCDGRETGRPEFCEAYPAGNFKPVGQIQKNAKVARLAVFGYLAEDGGGRYGGVMRSPMGYVGPTKPDATGAFVANPTTEWSASNGVFTTNPQNQTGFAPAGRTNYSGGINYLNRFGTLGTLGYYKHADPIGELYYEALRYYMGLGPTLDAYAGMSAGSYDGYPVYTNWTDALANACQRRNYILVIGDAVTNPDKQLPGYGGPYSLPVEPNDPKARGAESLKGGGTFDAAYWTKTLASFEVGASDTFTNSLGATVSTAGNPNPDLTNDNLSFKMQPGGLVSGYFWAGAAYWAHTQPIRNDVDAKGVSMSKVRVNTFTIDVDTGGNGTIDNSPRTSWYVRPRNGALFLAGKYGWFNNTANPSTATAYQPLANGVLGANEQLDGQPFRNVLTGALDNSRWEYPSQPNTPDGYVIASQASKMLDGIKRFYSSIGENVVPPTVNALSSSDFSTAAPDGDVFVPRFTPKNWAGTLLKAKVKYDVSTGKVAITTTTWDAGQILTSASVATGTVTDPLVKPASRKIFTFASAAANRGGQDFTVANKAKLDPEVLTALATRPAGTPTSVTTSGMQDATINYLRGDRSQEITSTSGYLRPRSSIMGDIVNSGPVYKQGGDPDVTGPGYGDFLATQKTRTGVVYVGANDGMLHAFRVSDGKELFAYLPYGVATQVHKLADPAYAHQAYVDAVPLVGEVQRNGQWRTVLVSGFGAGAQGIFILDVTDPTNFTKSNVISEVTDQTFSDLGNVIGQPKLVRMKVAGGSTTKWYVAVTTGFNNYVDDGNRTDGTSKYSTTGQQALLLIGLDNPDTETYKINLPTLLTSMPAALSNPGVAYDVDGNAVMFYAGDTQGNLWKFDFRQGVSAANVANSVKTIGGTAVPMAILKDASGNVQPITTAPNVAPGLDGGYMVMVGTGKFLESGDADSTEVNAFYGIWDNLTTKDSDFQITRAKLFGRSFTSAGVTTGASTFTFGDGASSTYRGWYVTMPLTKERLVTDPDTRFGYTAVSSLVPPADCDATGSGALMCFNNLYGTSECTRNYQSGALSRAKIIHTDLALPGDYSYTERSATGKRALIINSSPVATNGGNGGTPSIMQGGRVSTKVPAGRVAWREIKNFKAGSTP